MKKLCAFILCLILLAPNINADSKILRAYDLRGPVYSVATTMIPENSDDESGHTTFMQFDDKGRLTAFSNMSIIDGDSIRNFDICRIDKIQENKPSNVETDPDIDEDLPSELEIYFTRKIDSRKFRHTFDFGDDYIVAHLDTITHEYKFDKKGNIVKDSFSPESFLNNEGLTDIFGYFLYESKYEPREFDKWGNWTRRTGTVTNLLTMESVKIEEKRRISYWKVENASQGRATSPQKGPAEEALSLKEKKLLETYDEIALKLLNSKDLKEAHDILEKYQTRRKIKNFGDLKSRRNLDDCYIIIGTTDYKTDVILGPKPKRTNWKTGEKDSLENYRGRPILWFMFNY